MTLPLVGAAGRLRRAVQDLSELLDATGRIIAQTRQRMAGITPDGATRGSACTTVQARPIAKGRLGKPVEFGYKAQVVDNDDGIVLDHTVQPGQPADAPQLAPAVERVIDPHRHAATHRSPPTAATAKPASTTACHDLGVRTVVIPRKGKPGKARQAVEHRPAFRKNRQMAHRLRRPDQQPQTRIRLGPHPPGHRRSPDLDRTRDLHPQPGQDRTARRVDYPHKEDQHPVSSSHHEPKQHRTAATYFFRSK